MKIAVKILLLATLLSGSNNIHAQSVINLAGEWGFQLDPNDFERAFENSGAHKNVLMNHVTLPGTTDSNKKGNINTGRPINRLSRYYEYVGPAWYQKDVVIPDDWNGKNIELFLERVLWISSVYVDGKLVGEERSFSTPHSYNLSSVLSPGKHRITLCVDNRVGLEFDRWSHAFSEYTQTCWNGVVGKIELRASNPVDIKSIQVYPDVDSKRAKVVFQINNPAGEGVNGSVVFSAATVNSEIDHKTKEVSIPISDSGKEISVEGEILMGEGMQLWDEFTPTLYELSASMNVESAIGKFTENKKEIFGMRKIASDGAHFTLNNRKIFLRGTLECAIFPLTGYPDMSIEGWLRICNIVKDYGLNHIRFHSWCPPEEAFIAADQVGILLQAELPFWAEATQPEDPLSIFLMNEMTRILDQYGNHPSFALLCMGNELRGNFDIMAGLVNYGREHDPRHLYSGSTARKHLPEDQFYVSHQTSGGGITTYGARGPQTDYDLREAYSVLKVPGVAHEVGQRAVYPNFDEIEKYTGVLYPRNFELFRDTLEKHGMLDQAKDFFNVSGNMTVMLYKESIEALLRTPNCGGFQLLELNDFPGQGTALVGILDPFWDSKGFISPEEFRRFCGPTVPILRMTKREYFNDEVFIASAEIYHYDQEPLNKASLRWDIQTKDLKTIASGKFNRQTIPVSSLTSIGEIKASLKRVTSPQKLLVTIHVNEDIQNEWEIWVYPKVISKTPDETYSITSELDEATMKVLDRGGKVLLLPDIKQLEGKNGSFQNHFWCPIMFRWEPMTMGTLVKNEHPAFKHFPTESYTRWQWWNIISQAVTLNLEGTADSFRPILQSIDTYDRCLKQGIIFEAKVGKGKLLMAAIDFEKDIENRPAAQQLLASLKSYVGSDEFSPDESLPVDFIGSMFKQPTLTTGAKIILCDSYEKGNEPDKVIDNNPSTIWHTAYDNPGNFAVTNRQKESDYPHEIQIELAQLTEFSGFKYYPRKDGINGYIAEYEFFVSDDRKAWGNAIAKGRFRKSDQPQTVLLEKPQTAKFIRFVALRGFNGQKWASMAELELVK